MENYVKFSIIIPTYNRAVFLNDLLGLLSLQTYKNFEVIISDDGSNDNTRLIVEKFITKLNIKYLYNDNWGGPAKPRNIAISNSIGEYICFLDSDDLWYPEKLFYVNNNLNKSVDVYYHKFISNNKVIGDFKLIPFYNTLTNLFINGNQIVNSSLIVKRSAILKVGCISEDRKIIGVEDFHLILKLAYNNYKFKKISQILGEYRINDSSISLDQFKQITKTRIIYKEYYKYFSNKRIKENKSLLMYLYSIELLKNNKKQIPKKFLIYSILNGSITIKLKSFYYLIKIILGVQ
jgi:glycosyltransferase involved in cell wall biosynthesis